MIRIKRLFAALLLASAVAGCAEASAEVDAPPAMPADPQVARGAERALAAAPTPKPDWHTGVVLTEERPKGEGLFGKYTEWSISVFTPDGVTYLSGRWCGNDDGDTALSTMVDPGDLITWRTSVDHEVCASMLRVLRKAAAQAAAAMKAPA